MLATLELQPLVTDRDWELAVAYRNRSEPTHPVTIEEARESAAMRAKHGFFEQFLFLDGNQPIAMGGLGRAFWTREPSFYLYACPAPDHLARYAELLRTLEARAAGLEAGVWTTHGRSDCPWTVEVPPTLGYRVTQSNRALKLTLDHVDSGSGRFEILSYREFAARRPKSWERELWRLEMDLMHDVPLPEPFSDIPFEQYLERIRSPFVHLEASFVALVAGEPAGLTQLHPNHADRTLATTGLTGVLLPHRRQGIARDLKLHAMAWAKEAGIRRVMTDTEEANPMGQLNRMLGFEFSHDLVLMAKEPHLPSDRT